MPRSSGFGSCPPDSPRLNTVTLVVRLRSYRFPSAFPDTRVRLVRQAHSLVRFSKRTTEHRLPSRLTTGSHLVHSERDLVCPVALSPTEFTPYCTSLFGVLFSVRSRYLFAIGLEECLVFAVNARGIHEGIPTPATLELTPIVLIDGTGLSPCFVLYSKRLLVDGRMLQVSPNTTLPVRASVWTVSGSLAVTNDIAVCFLFLSILRCFNSRRSPLRKAIARGFLFGDPKFFPSVRVPWAYRSLARPSSALEPSDPPVGTVATFFRIGCYTKCSGCDPGTGPVDAWTTRTHGLICHQ